MTILERSGVSKQVLESELNQPRRNRTLGDDAESGRPKSRSWVGELGMVKGIVELDAKCEFRAFPDSSHRRSLADRKIRIELSRPGDDIQPCIAVSRRTVRADYGCLTDHRRS